MKREDIHIISRYSNWSKNGVNKALQNHVYHNTQSWRYLLRLLFLSLGTGFTISGIIFFFAYNWDDLHKFFKLGLIEGLIILVIIGTLIFKPKKIVSHISLTLASLLVGVLLAVFGQIYQTGANAYDLFLTWTLFITLWVLISNFSPLWLIYLLLVNTTVVLYAEQVAHNWTDEFIFLLLFAINLISLVTALLIPRFNEKLKSPLWFTHILALAACTFATFGVINGIYENQNSSFWIILALAIIAYTAGIGHGLKAKSAFYLSIIPFSFITIISALIIKEEGGSMFLLVSLFIIASVTVVIKFLINLQKKWKHE